MREAPQHRERKKASVIGHDPVWLQLETQGGTVANQWSVKKIPSDHPRHSGSWGVYDKRSERYGPTLHDVFDTLKDAHTYATQLAVLDSLFEPGGLTLLRTLQKLAG